jgi:hypothetical protein
LIARVAVALVVAIVASTVAAPRASGRSTQPWGELPAQLVRVLEAKAEGYARRALGFTCRERIRTADYDGGRPRSEDVREYAYLLVRDETSPHGFRAVRTEPDDPRARPVDLEFPFPEPYAWTQIFTPTIRSTMRHRVGDWRTTPWKLAIPISWLSSAPVGDLTRTTEWSGTMDVEFRTGNAVRVVATPSFQDQRMRVQLERYLQATSFMGYSFASPPDGLEIEVLFDHEHEGYTYPSRIELRRFRQIHRDHRVTISRQVITYTDYKFFGTEVEEEIPPLTYQPAAR